MRSWESAALTDVGLELALGVFSGSARPNFVRPATYASNDPARDDLSRGVFGLVSAWFRLLRVGSMNVIAHRGTVS
jgi:hypothetical protein